MIQHKVFGVALYRVVLGFAIDQIIQAVTYEAQLVYQTSAGLQFVDSLANLQSPSAGNASRLSQGILANFLKPDGDPGLYYQTQDSETVLLWDCPVACHRHPLETDCPQQECQRVSPPFGDQLQLDSLQNDPPCQPHTGTYPL